MAQMKEEKNGKAMAGGAGVQQKRDRQLRGGKEDGYLNENSFGALSESRTCIAGRKEATAFSRTIPATLTGGSPAKLDALAERACTVSERLPEATSGGTATLSENVEGLLQSTAIGWTFRAVCVAFGIVFVGLPYLLGVASLLGAMQPSIWLFPTVGKPPAAIWEARSDTVPEWRQTHSAEALNHKSMSDRAPIIRDGRTTGGNNEDLDLTTGQFEEPDVQEAGESAQSKGTVIQADERLLFSRVPRRLSQVTRLPVTTSPVFSPKVLPEPGSLYDEVSLRRMVVALFENKLSSLKFERSPGGATPRKAEVPSWEAEVPSTPTSAMWNTWTSDVGKVQVAVTQASAEDENKDVFGELPGNVYEDDKLTAVPAKLALQLTLAISFAVEMPERLWSLSCPARLSRLIQTMARYRQSSNLMFNEWRNFLEKYHFMDEIHRGARFLTTKYGASEDETPQIDKKTGSSVCYRRAFENEQKEDPTFRRAAQFLIRDYQPFYRFGMFHRVTRMVFRAMATPYLLLSMSKSDVMEEFSLTLRLALSNYNLLHSLSSTVTMEVDRRAQGVVIVMELRCLPKALGKDCELRGIERLKPAEVSERLDQFQQKLEAEVHKKLLKAISRYQNVSYGTEVSPESAAALPRVKIIGAYMKVKKGKNDHEYSSFGHLLPHETYQYLKKEAGINRFLVQTVLKDTNEHERSALELNILTMTEPDLETPRRTEMVEPSFRKTLCPMQASQFLLREISFDPFVCGARLTRVLHTSFTDFDYSLNTPVTLLRGEMDPDHVIVFRGLKEQLLKPPEQLSKEFMDVLHHRGEGGRGSEDCFDSRITVEGTAFTQEGKFTKIRNFGKHLEEGEVRSFEKLLSNGQGLVELTIVGLGNVSNNCASKTLTAGEVSRRLIKWSLVTGHFHAIHHAPVILQQTKKYSSQSEAPQEPKYPLWVVVTAILSPTLLFALILALLRSTNSLQWWDCLGWPTEEILTIPGIPLSPLTHRNNTAALSSRSDGETQWMNGFRSIDQLNFTYSASSGRHDGSGKLFVAGQRHSWGRASSSCIENFGASEAAEMSHESSRYFYRTLRCGVRSNAFLAPRNMFGSVYRRNLEPDLGWAVSHVRTSSVEPLGVQRDGNDIGRHESCGIRHSLSF